MNETRRAFCGAAAAVIGLSACEPAAPPHASVTESAEPAAIRAGETLPDLVRRDLIDIFRDEDAFSRARRLGALLPTLGPDLVPSVTGVLQDRSLDWSAPDLELMLRYWARHEPEAAARWAKDKSPTDYRPGAVHAALSVWAAIDPQTAAEVAWPWAVTPTLERIVPSALVIGWYAAGEPAELTRWIHDHPVGVPRQRALAAYIRAVIQREGADAVQRWAESLPDEDEAYKLTVFRRVTDALASLDVQAGMRWCEAHCDGPYGNNMRSLIARSWVLEDGPAALAWLASASESRDRDFAMRLTFGVWSRADRDAALRWMAAETSAAAEPASAIRTLYPLYARLLAEDDPAEAIVWAGRIENEEERESMLIKVARVWRYLDEDAAEKWLLESPLSEAAREEARTRADEDAADS